MLSDINSVFTAILTMVTSVGTFIISNDITLYMVVGTFLGGAAVGLVTRLFHS